MIQVIGLRDYLDKKTGKTKLKTQYFLSGKTVASLFKNIDKVLSKIPKDEHFNLYYTALNCVDPGKNFRKLRVFESQKAIPFDIDGIDREKYEEYIPIILKTLGVEHGKTGIVFTGNGLQFIIEIQEAFEDDKYFDKKREHYKSICARIDREFKKAGLPGNADSSVWSPARLLRLPGTENRKAAPKGTTKAILIQGNIEPQDFTLGQAADIPVLEDAQHLVDWSPKNQPKVDKKEIFQSCHFIKWARETPEEVREPHFYAAVSILARMENGLQLTHQLAESVQQSGSDSSVAGFSHSEVEQKVDQALRTSGPRTCKGIDTIWSKCSTCPQYNKITSPIQIKGEDFIATAETCFHRQSKNGKLVPEHRDLLKHFNNQCHHKQSSGGITFIYEESHYQSMERARIREYAYKHYNPEGVQGIPFANSHVCQEFLALVERTDIKNQKFFVQRGRINVANGVFDLSEKRLLPHSPDFGFQYILDYDYDKKASCPKFDSFLSQICCDDKELETVLLEFMGYALSGDSCWAQKCLLLTGEGANGKSTFISLMEQLAGEDNVSALALKSMNKPTSVSLMEDKLFNISEEMPQGKDIESSDIKNLISGGKVEARHLYKDSYFMENKAKLIFACNELPVVNDTTMGYFRRFIIIPFNATFDEVHDPTNKTYKANRRILKTLLPERSGILNRVIAAYTKMIDRQRFTHPKAHAVEMENYKIGNDPLRYWVEKSERLIVRPFNGRITWPTIRDLYTSYSFCMELEARTRPMSFHKFTKRLRKLVPQGEERSSVKKIDGKPQRVMFDLEIQELD